MATTKVHLVYFASKETELIEVPALSVVKGLAINKAVRLDKNGNVETMKGFFVTHAPSGYLLHTFRLKRDAVTYRIGMIETGIDFTKPDPLRAVYRDADETQLAAYRAVSATRNALK